MAVAPKATIAAPRPTAARFGLFSQLTFPTQPSPYWQNGAQWEEICSVVKGLGDWQCSDAGADSDPSTIGLPKDLDAAPGLVVNEASPFTLYAPIRCSLVSLPAAEAAQRANDALLTKEEYAVEHAIWTGEFGNPGFAKDAVKLTTAATKTPLAIGLLEDWIGDNIDGTGVIHVDRTTAVILASKGLVTVSGSSMTTTLGTPVVAGRGYPGSAPDGTAAAAGQSWAYATGQLIGLRSDIFSGLGDGAAAGMPYLPNNDQYAIAERTYVVGWTGCTENRSAAVNLDLEG